jgi:hypothetical protein
MEERSHGIVLTEQLSQYRDGVRFTEWARDLSFHSVQNLFWVSASLQSQGVPQLLPKVTQTIREGDPFTSTECYTSTPSQVFMAQCLIY